MTGHRRSAPPTPRLAAWAARGQDDRGSMAMAMLAVLVGATLGALMLPMVVTQAQSTRFDLSRARSQHAAQTGQDVMLGLIRASTTTDEDGAVSASTAGLPCATASAPLTGNATGTGDTTGTASSRYSVHVDYYTVDADSGQRIRLVCRRGIVDGVKEKASLLSTRLPRYAVVTSTGTDPAVPGGSRGRTLVSTYVFGTADRSAAGGIIRAYPPDPPTDQAAASKDPVPALCLDAGSAPRAGAPIELQECSTSTPPAARQAFTYRRDLSIQLVSSVTSTERSGLCVTATSDVPAVGDEVALAECRVVDPAACTDATHCSPADQQWRLDEEGRLRGTTRGLLGTDGVCLGARTREPGESTGLLSCDGDQEAVRTWILSPTAGSGMAGTATGQLVNAGQSPACLDVVGSKLRSVTVFLRTCHQEVDSADLPDRQRFTASPALSAAPTTTVLLLGRPDGGATSCLSSPGTEGAAVQVGSVCPADPAAEGYGWTVYQSQDASGRDLPAALAHTIVDSAGLCLAPGLHGDLLDGVLPPAVVAACDGSTAQKWNVGDSATRGRMSDTHEVE